MNKTLVQRLAEFASEVSLEQLPEDVVEDSKRVLLDSIGCALAGVDEPKSRIGADLAQLIAGGGDGATIFGTSHRSSVYGAAFANGESINALDFDSVLPPGHVAPYVLPGAIAVAEAGHSAGRRVLEAIAVSHEISYRFGRSMDYMRTPKDGGMDLPEVLGFTSTVFGGAVAVAMLEDQGAEQIAHALGIAGHLTPVNSYRTWMDNVPNSTVKYTMAGPVTQAALTAAHAARLGHTGDLRILDDEKYGYRRFIGSVRWEPSNLVDGLGETWGFPAAHSYKPYPHCRVGHTPLDALNEILGAHDIAVEEIDAIRCWGEGWVEQPVWLNNDVRHPHEAQFSIAHGLAVGAHRIPPGPAWQSAETLSRPSVLALMEKVTFAPHPDYVQTLSQDPSARPTRVEVDARGTTFRAERTHPKGTPSADPSTYLTTDELVAKFRANASGVLPADRIDEVVDGVLHLEKIDDVQPLVRAMGTGPR
ncbi:MmgE/PrpD family protein [Aeromicrobium senzhongii]|uniref:MmgE/PrpD family protein n=1 Tax=Aeromicrobium senzhongii TaxID=2663859 RepID=A0ABX6SU25_9ACTN|nr:MmgE/PrpD family protein [Aeromicrobium senzhongii]MTB88964.1 MmgE/PrpD family protein [Aeromicrobium senzhongii]QNL93755.1 MmgE/PrpD family protein [Aeromicrobium senzhongii]